MPSIPSNQLQYVEIAVLGTVAAGGSNTKNFANVFQFRRLNTALPIVKANIEAAFQAAIPAVYIPLLNVAYTQVSNNVRLIDDATDPITSVARAVAGGIATTRSQDYDAVKMGYITNFRGRQFQGRKHFGPLSDADAVGDVLVGASLTAWQAMKTTLAGGFTDSNANVWIPCVVSKGARPPRVTSQLKTNPTTIVAADVLLVTLNKTLGTMRRRKVKTVLG